MPVKEDILDILINQYYDKQMNDYELMNFEKQMVLKKDMKEYVENRCDKLFKISRSINNVKSRNAYDCDKLFKKLKRNNKLFFYINTVRFKCFYKHLRNRILNILRYNSK